MLSEVAGGVATLLRGFGLMIRRPRLFLLGALPPLITSTLFVIVLLTLVANLSRLVGWLSSFAADAPSWLFQAVQVLIGAALLAGSVLIMVVFFSALTLALGSPLYDKIAELTEAELGDAPEPVDEPVVTGLLRGVRQALALLGLSVAGSLIFLLIGAVPLVGQLVAPILSACFGGWLVCLELTGSAFDRRGLTTLRQRHRAMGQQRARVLGFAVPTFLLIAIPFLSVLVFPAATIGGTMLGRRLAGTGRE